MNFKKCSKCGKELTEDVNFCPYCGNALTEDIKEIEAEIIIKPKKQKRTGIMIFFSIVIIIALVLVNNYYFKPLNFKKQIIEEAINGDASIASDMATEYFEKYGVDVEISEAVLQGLTSNIENLLSLIPDVDIHNIRYSSTKGFVEFDVKNNSDKTLTYLEFDIRIYDSNEKVIDTDWTNWSGNLRPGDNAKVDAYVESGKGITINLSDWTD